MQKIISWVFQVLTYIDITAFLVLTVFLLLNYRRLPLVLKIFSCFEVVAFCIGASSLILAKLYIANTPLFHILYFIQILWFTVYYYVVLKEWRFNKSILIASGIFLGISIWKYADDWVEITSKVGGVYYFLSTALFVAFAVLFYVLMLTEKIKPKYQLINAAILIYYSCSSVIFLFSKYYYLEGFEGQMILWIFNVVLHILFVILIFVDVWRMLYLRPKTL